MTMKRNIFKYQEKVLKLLAGRIADFYLSGGTALSWFYFQHRVSEDLDFFTKRFDRARIIDIVKQLSSELKKKAELVSQSRGKNKVKILVYLIHFNKNEVLKIDFVEDYLELIKPLKLVNGIKVLSLEDIYIRKIFAITGVGQGLDSVGRQKFVGGRQEAKDFYDLYCLSHTFKRLSDFAANYCDSTTKEALIGWFRSYNRMEMKTGLLELEIKKEVNYPDLELHFKREIERLLEKEVEFI